MLLREKDKQILTQIFSSVTLPFEVWAYGSRVSGTAHSGSDLDLVICTPEKTKLPTDVLIGLNRMITESNIPILVQLFDWARLPESFQRNIEARHEVLYSNMTWLVKEPPSPYETRRGTDDVGK